MERNVEGRKIALVTNFMLVDGALFVSRSLFPYFMGAVAFCGLHTGRFCVGHAVLDGA